MDAHDPQLEQFDARVAEAVHDVPVPPGLAERLAAALRADAELAPAAAEATAAERGGPGKVGTVPGRRSWLMATAAGAAVAAAAAVAAVWFWPRSPELVSGEDLVHAARAFHQRGDGDAAAWQWGPPPRDYPMGNQMAVAGGVPWRYLPGQVYGRRGIGYRLAAPRQARATLLVIDRRGPVTAPQLAALPTTPLQNVLTTGGCTTAVWVEGPRVYVLVVDGDLRTFRSLVRQMGSMA